MIVICKPPRQDSGHSNFLKQDMQINVLPKFIEIYMETPRFSPSRWAPTWRPEPKRNISVTEFCYKSVNLSFEELKNIKIILLLIHEIPRNKSLLKPTWQLCRPSCKCCVKQRLRNSSVVYHKLKPWTHWERKFVCDDTTFQLLLYIMKVQSQEDQ